MTISANVIAQQIISFVREASLERLIKQSLHEDLTIQNADASLVYGHWTSIILVSGRDTKITFKTHFYTNDARNLADQIFENTDNKAIAVEQAHDFIKEYGNVTAGSIKKGFEKINIPMGISLPFIMRGFDEIFSILPNAKTSFSDTWKISNKEISIYCSCFVELFEITALSNLEFRLLELSSQEGEVIFL